jgi:glyoxylase I family protein
MTGVTGIGGFFFRARDPKGLARWYAEHLGVGILPDGPPGAWRQEAGPTVFEPFPFRSAYFGDPDKVWMLNLRVDDLDGMVNQLSAAGIVVTPHTETYSYGRFARLVDPEGNPIELWEPEGDAP